MRSKEKTLVKLVTHVSKLLSDRVRVAMEEAGVPHAQGWVLQVLAQRDDISQTELRMRMDVSAPTLTGILQRLEAESLISRARSDADFRVVYVRLSKKGRALARKARSALQDIEMQLTRGLNPRDEAQAHRLLLLLRDNLGGLGPEHFEKPKQERPAGGGDASGGGVGGDEDEIARTHHPEAIRMEHA